MGKTERGPCQRITYRKNIGGEISIWVALSAAADKAKGQNRNYPGAARTRGTRWGLVTPNNRGSTGPHNSHIFGGAPAAALYVPVFPLPRQLPCLVVVAAALPLPPRCHPPQLRRCRPSSVSCPLPTWPPTWPPTQPTAGRPSTSSFSRRARDTCSKTTNKTYGPKQQE